MNIIAGRVIQPGFRNRIPVLLPYSIRGYSYDIHYLTSPPISGHRGPPSLFAIILFRCRNRKVRRKLGGGGSNTAMPSVTRGRSAKIFFSPKQRTRTGLVLRSLIPPPDQTTNPEVRVRGKLHTFPLSSLRPVGAHPLTRPPYVHAPALTRCTHGLARALPALQCAAVLIMIPNAHDARVI